jgi:hypothetical protein
MATPLPVTVSDDLTIRIGTASAALTPTQGFAVAEQLLRKSTRRAIVDEAEDICGPEGSADCFRGVP